MPLTLNKQETALILSGCDEQFWNAVGGNDEIVGQHATLFDAVKNALDNSETVTITLADDTTALIGDRPRRPIKTD